MTEQDKRDLGERILDVKYYNSKERFISYWNQLNEVLTLKPKSVLEVGRGNSFLADFLRKAGIKVKTVDHDKTLNPDFACELNDIPVKDNSFDGITCFQTLEHVPFLDLPKALKEFKRITRHWLVLSVPNQSRVYRVSVEIPKKGFYNWLIPKPLDEQYLIPPEKEHKWEIGVCGLTAKRLIEVIEKQGFFVVNSFRVFENPYHHFFICVKVKE